MLEPNDKGLLIIVTSGSTQGLNVNHLKIPTIAAWRDLLVRLIVCAVHIPYLESLELPPNTRRANRVAVEEVFPHTSLTVSSGEYGGISQYITNKYSALTDDIFAFGIPIILAGTLEDKVETGLKAEATGVAIKLKAQTPSVDQVSDALDNMLHDTTTKKRPRS
ncbi:hypothetical protein AC579_8886 [Pseudocercospora musae]|uniref:Uncharacterized protein n=1 Tax=Pseudocercospora musae TaxID=113226 RepID=A0A139I6V9_9PEZI|nr:hypothetical protein AC579_8886 [Pseudocercospora musae]